MDNELHPPRVPHHDICMFVVRSLSLSLLRRPALPGAVARGGSSPAEPKRAQASPTEPRQAQPTYDRRLNTSIST